MHFLFMLAEYRIIKVFIAMIPLLNQIYPARLLYFLECKWFNLFGNVCKSQNKNDKDH